MIGIVASRITERYGLPSILITYDGSVGEVSSPLDVGKGSGRSVKGMNLVEALASCQDLLVRFGGHELAAGLMVRRGDVPALRQRLNDFAATHLKEEDLTVRLDADCEVRLRDLSMQLYEEICRMEPFGTANPAPAFVLKEAKLTGIFPMGGGKHVRLTVEQEGVSLPAVWFGKSATELPFGIGDSVDLLFGFGVNEFRGVCTIQLIVQDARRAERGGTDLFRTEKTVSGSHGWGFFLRGRADPAEPGRYCRSISTVAEGVGGRAHKLSASADADRAERKQPVRLYIRKTESHSANPAGIASM